MPDDVAEAARAGKRVMLYFGQPGCPYCKQLMEVNFRQRPIVERMQKEFVAIELSLFGDRELTWTDGRETTEKKLAAQLKVQYTPTLIFLDEKGAIAYRVNGYYAPARFLAALDQAWGRPPSPVDTGGKAQMVDEPFFLPLKDLRRKRPLAVVFETPYCAECEELHASVFQHPAVRAELEEYDVVRFALSGADVITAPAGRQAGFRLGAVVENRLCADDRPLRHEGERAPAHGSVLPSVPCRGLASLCLERRVAARAFLPAFSPGARRAPATSGKVRGPVGLASTG